MTKTTTLKLPAELKSRIEPLAAQEGKTPHAWMVDALKTQTELAELRRGFIRDALESAAEVLWRRPYRDPLRGGFGIHSRGLTAAA
ncbi:MAG: CopG family ribbon-helix-helix protein [Myxococcaceae bacterium]